MTKKAHEFNELKFFFQIVHFDGYHYYKPLSYYDTTFKNAVVGV